MGETDREQLSTDEQSPHLFPEARSPLPCRACSASASSSSATWRPPPPACAGWSESAAAARPVSLPTTPRPRASRANGAGLCSGRPRQSLVDAGRPGVEAVGPRRRLGPQPGVRATHAWSRRLPVLAGRGRPRRGAEGRAVASPALGAGVCGGEGGPGSGWPAAVRGLHAAYGAATGPLQRARCTAPRQDATHREPPKSKRRQRKEAPRVPYPQAGGSARRRSAPCVGTVPRIARYPIAALWVRRRSPQRGAGGGRRWWRRLLRASRAGGPAGSPHSRTGQCFGPAPRGCIRASEGAQPEPVN